MTNPETAAEPELTETQKAYNLAQYEIFQLAAYGHCTYTNGELLTDEGKRQQADYNDRIRAAREELEAALLRLVAEHAETFRGDWGVPADWLRSLADDPAGLSLLAVRPDERDDDGPAPAAVSVPPPAPRAPGLRAAAAEADRAGGLYAARGDEARAGAAFSLMEALTAMADCPSCDAGIEHTVHCPTPETHNWGCGCPSDVAAAIASCPGREMSPSPCRCPCEGCKHHCAAHNPAAVSGPCVAGEQQNETPEAVRTVAYGDGKGRVFCAACPRPTDPVPLTAEDVDHWELCPSCGRHVVDVARTAEPRP